jgi:O-antigen ligase
MNNLKQPVGQGIKLIIVIVSLLITGVLIYLSGVDPKMTIELILFLCAVLVFSFFPKIGLYGIALFLPIIGWSFYVSYFQFTLIDFLSFIVLIGFYVRLIYKRLFTQDKPSLRWPILVPFLSFFLAVFLSSFINPGPWASAWYAIRIVIFFYLAYVSLPASIITNKQILKKVIIFISISGLAVALSGILSLLYQHWDSNFFRIQGLKLFGVYPVGDNHNLIAEFLVITNFFLLALRYWCKSERTKRIINLVFIGLTIITLLTFSRTAWIVIALQLVLLFILKQTSKFKIVAIFAIAIIILLPVIFKMSQLQEENLSSTENRLLLSEISWQAFIEKPLLGHGTGSFVDIVSRNIRYQAKYGAPVDSHGVLQKIITENGFLGFITFAWVVIVIFMVMLRAINRYTKHRELIVPMVIGCFGGFISEFFNTSYYKGKFWFPLAVTLVAINIVKSEYVNDHQKN